MTFRPSKRKFLYYIVILIATFISLNQLGVRHFPFFSYNIKMIYLGCLFIFFFTVIIPLHLKYSLIQIENGLISQKSLWQKKVSFPILEIDKVRSQSQSLMRFFTHCRIIYSNSNQKIYFPDVLWEKKQIKEIYDALGF